MEFDIEKQHRITTQEIEIAVVNFFGLRKNLMILPNVHFGFDVHECDILVVKKSMYCAEVEIKCSRADLLADKKKRHAHESNKIKELWFAIPEALEASIPDIPERAGVLIIREWKQQGSEIIRRYAFQHRNPTPKKDSRKITEKELIKLGYLAFLRFWKMKQDRTAK